MSEQHAETSKTSPQQTILSVLGGLLALAIAIYLVVQLVLGIGAGQLDKDSPTMSAQAVAERIRPVGKLTVTATARAPAGAAPAAKASGGAEKGKAAYAATCSICHATGVAGAPKVGDKAGWKARIAQGSALLYQHALKGFTGKSGIMPAKGGNAGLSDADVKAAVDYMVGLSK